ncbi:OLC1v1036778C1 [Oldenlandia corymbosa var. corymbosa]|uniref:OLC1v1036778C1 n=1 Tax=Oldenlandia corymbosa var. corymbosa TaxID=529605 RepID=A0AAV1CXB0_OLDCO|nr:OLC1v1036778C1 [Oldenlandia corymbosa var. corymbosa]
METYKPKNILITGAVGFIASHVANRLIRTYPDYHVTHVDNSFGNSFEFTKNNIYGTHVLLEACKQKLVLKVIAYGRSYGLPVITIRQNNVYRPNQFPEKLIATFLLLAMKRENFPIHGDGSNVWSYLYCEDVAEAFEIILDKGEVGHVYNIGTSKDKMVLDIARDICKFFSINPEDVIKFVDNRPFNDQRYFLDHQKLQDLGWSERTIWEEGPRKTMEWYVNNLDWWGDVSRTLVPHPRMLMMPGNGKNNSDVCSESYVQKNSTQKGMVVPAVKNNSSIQKPSRKFLIYGRTDQMFDWYESHKLGMIQTNVACTLTLADVCGEHGLLMLNFATGCIFEYDFDHPLGIGIGFKEDDKPNFTGLLKNQGHG